MKKKLLIFIFIFGLILILYPFISNFIGNFTQTKIINHYQDNISAISEAELKEKKEAAVEYNNQLSGNSNINTGNSYADILEVGEVMAYIEIPKIAVNLPIYQGVSEEVLDKGIGHMEHSSLPIGGISTHAILTGHTGLISATLFSDLDQLVYGDIFYIKILDEILSYEVESIFVVNPDDVSKLEIIEGKDYITLITCTPYMVNTQRLLVRGIRSDVVYIEDEVQEKVETNTEIIVSTEVFLPEFIGNTDQYMIIYVIGICLLISIFYILFYLTRIRFYKSKKYYEKELIFVNLNLETKMKKINDDFEINDFPSSKVGEKNLWEYDYANDGTKLQ